MNKLVLISALFLLCSCRGCALDPSPFAAAQYETYAGTRFEIIHEGELGQYYTDTVEVVSKTERAEETELRLINGGRRIIRPPDYTIQLED